MRFSPFFITLTFFILVGANVAHSGPDTVSTAFNDNADNVYRAQNTDFGSVASLLVLPDGSLLVGSNEMATTLNGSGDPLAPLLRFNPDGTVDEDYFADTTADGEGEGIIFTGTGDPEIIALGRQSDGKIIAAGVLTGMNDGTTNVTSRSIVRINIDATPDATFQTEGTIQSAFLNYINHLIIDPDDKIVVSGGFQGIRDKGAPSWTRRHGVARLHADGSLDTSFEIDPIEFGVPSASALSASAIIYQVERDSSGRYYIVGEFSGFGDPINVFARLLPDGSRDFSFTPNLPDSPWNSVALDRQGRITVTASNGLVPSTAYRLLPDGSIDNTFASPVGWGTQARAQPLEIDSAGRFLYVSGGALGRVLADGTIDSTFNPTASNTDLPNAPSVSFNLAKTAPDGSIYGGGFFDQVEGNPIVKLVRFDGNPIADALLLDDSTVSITENSGSLYLSVTRVGPSIGTASLNFSTVDGTALAGADFTAASGTLNWAAGESGSKTIAVPLVDNGASDGNKNFSVNLSGATGSSISGASTANITIVDDEAGPTITAQPLATSVDQGQDAVFTVGVNSATAVTFQWLKDGFAIPDATGITLTIAASSPSDAADYSVEVTSAGVTVSSDTVALTVISPAADVEPGFSYTGVTTPDDFQLLADGSVLILDGTDFAGFTLRKLDSDFKIDNSFSVTTTPLSGFSATSAQPNPIPLPNGQWLAYGLFDTINGEARPRLARMNADGSVDLSFDPFFNSPFTVNGFSANFSSLSGVKVTESGDIYAMVRTSNQGIRLFRMLSDGSMDTSFTDSANYSSGNLLSLIELDDGSIIVSTNSTTSSLRGIRRLNADGTVDTNFNSQTNLSPAALDLTPIRGERFAALRGLDIEIFDYDGNLLDTIAFDGSSNFGSLGSIRAFRGRILVVGATSFDGQAVNELALINLDGTIDSSFPGGSGPDEQINQIEVDTQGRIVVGGQFTTWNGTAADKLTRLVVNRAEIAFAASSSETFEDAGPASIELIRFGDTSGAASVRVQSVSNSAISGDDFAAYDQVISWTSGDDSSKFASVTITDDALIEGDEAFTLSLFEATGASVVPGDHTVTIFDDDSLPQITAQPVDADTLDGGSVTFTVNATSPTTITYQWFFNGQELPGETSASLTIDPAGSSEEGDYSVVLTNDYGTVTSNTASLTIIEDPTDLIDGFVGIALNNRVRTIVPASDGGAYIGGDFTDVGGDTTRDYLIKVDATGALDTTFSPPTLSDSVYKIAVQPNGRILAAGDFRDLGTGNARGLGRFLPDGSLDTDFMTNIGVGAVNATLRSVAVMPEGKIVIGGGTNLVNWNGNTSSFRNLVRLSDTGAFEDFYATTDALTVGELLPLPDGKLLAAYDFSPNSTFRNIVRRFNSDLTEDTSFVYRNSRTEVFGMALAADGTYIFGEEDGVFRVSDTGTILATLRSVSGGDFFDVAVQVNGKILIGSGTSPRLERYLSNDSQDSVFKVGFSDYTNDVLALAIADDGVIWVGGNFTSTTPARLVALKGDPVLLAITSNPQPAELDLGATLNLTGGAIGTTTISYQWFKGEVALVDGGRISGATTDALTITGLVEGDEGTYTFTATNASGTETSSGAFIEVLGVPEITSLSGDVSTSAGQTINLSVSATGASGINYQWRKDGSDLTDGDMISGATTANLTIAPSAVADSGTYTVFVSNSVGDILSDYITVTVSPNNAVFADSWTAPTIDGTVSEILPLAGARALVAGNFTSISDGSVTSNAGIAVVNENGSVADLPNLTVSGGAIFDLWLQTDGKILLAGSFTNINGTFRNKVARLNSDFTLDTTFTPSGPGFGNVFTIAEEAAGTIMIGGEFFNYDSQANTLAVVRLSSAGAYDSSFASGANFYVYTVTPQSDGTVVIGGQFSAWSNDFSAGYLVKTDASGGLLEGLATGSFISEESDLFANGDIFASSRNNTDPRRFAQDGTRDLNFLSGILPDARVRSFAEFPDGSFALGGDFTQLGTTASGSVGIVNSDALTLDSGFIPGAGFNGNVEKVAVAESGALWVGGDFTDYNGVSTNYLTLLKAKQGSSAPDPLEAFLDGTSVPVDQRDPEDDWDADNIPNVVELLYMLDPEASDTIEITMPLAGDSGSDLNTATGTTEFDVAEEYFTFSVLIPTDLLGYSFEVQAATDLSNFTSSPLTIRTVGSPTPAGVGFETATYVIESPLSSTPAAFVRVNITK